jgi:hypothetical protein
VSAQKRLSLCAWAALAVHLVAGLSMLLVLRWGLQTNPSLADRLNFVVEERAMWTIGWLTWTAAGASILAFYAAYAKAHEDQLGVLAWAALGVTVVAIALDWTAQGIFVFVLPRLAREERTASFLLLSRDAVLLTGGAANTLYTAAAALLLWPTKDDYPAWTARAGLGVVVFGAVLTVASCANSTRWLYASNAGLVPCLTLWLAGTALKSSRREG